MYNHVQESHICNLQEHSMPPEEPFYLLPNLLGLAHFKAQQAATRLTLDSAQTQPAEGPQAKPKLEHAVPLNEEYVHALAHNCMALDIYTWLTQQLVRSEGLEPPATCL
jgi:hypothetical protein